MSQSVQFTLENLLKLDFGKIAVVFNNEVKHVVQDCLDRAVDDRARKVAICFNLKPITDPTANVRDCEKVAVECEIQSTLPKRRTKVYDMVPKQDGTLLFHPELSDDPEGDALYDQDVLDRERQAKQDNGR